MSHRSSKHAAAAYFFVITLGLVAHAPVGAALEPQDAKHTPAQNGEIIGTWLAMSKDEPSLPGVELTLKEEADKLGGTITFYRIHEKKVAGKQELQIIEPRFDGKTLSFKVEAPDGKMLEARMTVTRKGEAVMKRADDVSGDTDVKMIKQGQPIDHERQVREFVDAFNSRSIETMLAAVDENVQWLNVDGAKISVEAEGKSALRSSMERYFRTCLSCKSVLDWVQKSGSRVTALERASWAGNNTMKSQRSLSVYEFRGGKIFRVYYFPAEADAPRQAPE